MKQKTMRNMLLTIVLAISLIFAMGITTFAASVDVAITDATYHSGGALAGMTTEFSWGTASANSRLLLMKNKLQDDDLTNLGDYGSSFGDLDAVLTHDTANGTFGIKAYSAESAVSSGTNHMSISFADGIIPLDTDATYYLYLWTRWGIIDEYYYPDHLIAAIKVQNGMVQYAEATGPNTYDESDFNFVVAAEKYDVTVVPAANMTKTAESGAAAQTDLDVPMETVVYTADTGYYFPEDYAVADVNNIRVTRIDETRISISGMPLADTTVNLIAPTKQILPLESVAFGYAYDAQRMPAFPEAGDEITVNFLNYPLIAPQEFGTTNEGDWTLSKVGTYSIIKDTVRDSVNLQTVVGLIADNYPEMTDANIVIHELKDGETHISYGVAVAYDEDNGLAIFIGDTWGGGAGYLLATTAQTGEVTCMADTDVTDWVAPAAYNIGITGSQLGTTTASAAKAIEGDTVVITTAPAEGAKLTQLICSDGTNNLITTYLGDGQYSFVMPAGDVTVIATYALKEYTVTYKVNGETLDTLTVKYGEDASAPAVPAKEGYTGAWDQDGKAITADTVINAVYTVKTYTVTYKVNGEVVATLTVEHGKDATAPRLPAKEGYTAKWSKDGKAITADTVIEAVYTVKTYTVTYTADGETVATVTVEHGKDATAPKLPAKEGYTAAWDHNGKAITADTEIKAVYKKILGTDQPKTGDSSHAFLFLALMLASGAALLGLRLCGKKQEG